jgi:hypothetical protein
LYSHLFVITLSYAGNKRQFAIEPVGYMHALSEKAKNQSSRKSFLMVGYSNDVESATIVMMLYMCTCAVHFIDTSGTNDGAGPAQDGGLHFIDTSGANDGAGPAQDGRLHFIDTSGNSWGEVRQLRQIGLPKVSRQRRDSNQGHPDR